MVEATLIK